jgi:hypothetical protein
MVILSMIMIFILSIFNPLLCLFAYREGLKHSYETKNNIKPSSIININKVKESKSEEMDFNNLMNEYMYGEQSK